MRDGLSSELGRLLRLIARSLNRFSRELERTAGVSETQLSVLRELAERGPAASGELARRLDLAQATMSECVANLVASNLIERARSDHDRRVLVCAVTPRGVEIASRCRSLLDERIAAAFDALPDWERTSMVSALQRVSSMMERPPEASERMGAPSLTTPAGADAGDGRGSD